MLRVWLDYVARFVWHISESGPRTIAPFQSCPRALVSCLGLNVLVGLFDAGRACTGCGVQGSIAFRGVFREAVYRVSIAEVMVFSFVMSIGGG